MADTNLIKPSLRAQHAPDRPLRSGRPLRRPADHGAQRLCLYRPRLLERLFRHRRARPDQAEDGQLHRRTRPTPGACIFRCTTTSCSWSMAGTCSRSRRWRTSATTTSRRPEPTVTRRVKAAQLVGRHGRLRYLEARRAAADRLHARRRHRAAPHLVCRRALGLRLGDAGGVQRLHPDHHRHAGSGEAPHRRPLLASGDEPRGGRNGGPLAVGARPLRPAPRRGPGRHRLLRLARRLPGRGRRRRQGNPKQIVHKNWAPPFGGGTHNCLPLPDRDLLIVLDETVLDKMEDGFKPIWVFDNQVKANPISIATFPLPDDKDYIAVGGHFGPHNIHENRPGSFQSSTLIFATYQNAGVRVYDIRDHLRPIEVGACVPPAPKKLRRPAPQPAGGAAFGRRFRRQERHRLLHRLERRRSLHHGIHGLSPFRHPHRGAPGGYFTPQIFLYSSL